MLSSIHPLGERARHNRWSVTAASFTIGASASGAATGFVLGALGGLIPVQMSTSTMAVALGALALSAAALDLSGTRPPGPSRQVDERWIGRYRGWVYGVGFGAQLGTGVATFVVTWAVWALLLVELVIGSPIVGAIAGAAFGLGRSIGLLSAGWIDRPRRLTAFHSAMQRLAGPTHRIAAVATGCVGLAAVVAGAG